MKIDPKIKNARNEAVEEYFEVRRRLARLKTKVHDAENEILKDMFHEMAHTDEPLTAAEISAKLGGAMSKHEVAGQLTLICNSWVSQCRNPTHEAVQEEKDKKLVRKIERTKTVRFAEVNDKGEIVPDGEVFEKTIKKSAGYIKIPADSE